MGQGSTDFQRFIEHASVRSALAAETGITDENELEQLTVKAEIERAVHEEVREIYETLGFLADIFDQCAESGRSSPIFSRSIDGERNVSICSTETDVEGGHQFFGYDIQVNEPVSSRERPSVLLSKVRAGENDEVIGSFADPSGALRYIFDEAIYQMNSREITNVGQRMPRDLVQKLGFSLA